MTNQSKHTPGPAVRWYGFDASGYVVAESTGKAASRRTAAPELLEALEEAIPAMGADISKIDVGAVITKARAAIAKARGE